MSAELKQSCIGYQGNLARRYKELENLLVDNKNIEAVKVKTDQLHNVFQLYEAKFKEYIASINDEPSDTEDALQQFNSAKQNKEEFDERVMTWINAANLSTNPVVPEDDCRSLGSRRSSRSTHSSVSSNVSMRAKEARTRQIIAEQKLKQLAEKKALEEQRKKLDDRLAELDIKNERDNAAIEAEYWTQEAEEEVQRETDWMGQDVGRKPNISSIKGMGFTLPDIEAKNIGIQGVLEDNIPGLSPSSIYLSKERKVRHNEGKGNDVTANDVDYFQADPMNINHNAAQQLRDSMMLAINMPKPELVCFDGEPTKYWNFIHVFDVNVACRIKDERTKLMYLTQFCVGKAKEAIECCGLMNPKDGYKQARKILQKQFGQPHIITESLVRNVVNRPQVKPNDSNALSDLAREMRRCQITLEQMGNTADLNASDTLIKIHHILPTYLQYKWAEKADCLLAAQETPNFAHMIDMIERAAQISSNMYGRSIGKPGNDSSKPSQKGTTRNPPGRMVTSLATEGQSSQGEQMRKCPCCEGQHQLGTCPKFKDKPRRERLRLVREKRLCDNCFKPNHVARVCRSPPACTIEGCTWKHHSLLHFTKEEPQSDIPATDVNDLAATTEDPSGTNLSMVGSRRVCLRVLPVKVKANNRQVETWAILDNGSDVSLCDRSLAKELGLREKETQFALTTISHDNCTMKGSEVSFSVVGVEESDEIELNGVWTVDKLPISKESIPSQDDISKWAHLRGIALPQVEQGQVKLLIGGDAPEAFWIVEERRGKRKEPYAIRGLLGWTLMGPTDRVKDRRMSTFRTSIVPEEDNHLHEQVERFWKMESAGSLLETDVGESTDDKKARQMMENSIKKVNGHYQLDLPWKHEQPNLPNNRRLAEVRLRYLKKKLTKDDLLLQMYKDTMQGYLDKGHAREVPAAETMKQACTGEVQSSKRWYLPHHPVLHPHKPNKVRVVFDCAAKYQGISLNSQLLQGPDFTNSLVGVLTRFRQGKIALVADIEGMFHQVKVTPQDCDALRFLWWPNGDLQREPKEYQMLVHLFGATSSPSCAGYALRKTAEDSQLNQDDEAFRTVTENFYVDDCLKAVETQEEAVTLAHKLRCLLQSGGFRLTKWISNDPVVLKTIPESERAKSVLDLGLNDLPTERTLGILWNVKTDMFEFKVAVKEKPLTRRGILSVTSSLYDPLGFVSPFVLTAKILLQDTCAQGLGWDEPVGGAEESRWRQWLEELPQLSDISINRCLKSKSDKDIRIYELHVFCDASQRGYAAVTYLRTIDTAGNIHCSFVFGKTRLCPLKVMTIPRLELSAAVLACSISETVKRELRLPVTSTTFWTDSTSVLQYLRNESRRFHTFVANRISKIQDVSDPSQWRHVDTKSNPADDGSRGVPVRQLGRWIKGPEFLLNERDTWPVNPVVSQGNIEELKVDPEVKKSQVYVTMASSSLDELMKRFSTWTRLKRAVAWILRFKNYIKSKVTGDIISRGDLTVDELESAEREVICRLQRQSFPSEFLTGAGERMVSLDKLDPILVDGLLRVGGRLDRAPVENSLKYPLILPSHHHVTELIVVDHHQKVGHSGMGMTWASLRERYWIIKGGATVRRIIGNCFKCKRRNASRGQQFMADLPEVRVTPGEPPFTNTGVDFFGPFLTKHGRSMQKRYGCVFTCLVTRAVHLEMASSLDTDSFINTLRRFINRRGQPKVMLSDNGTNFKGGNKELNEALASMDRVKANKYLTIRGIKWHFNPPSASHMGGVWERVIRSVRRILTSLLQQQTLTDEALMTLFSEVEAILNARPLVNLSMDARDDEPLTPNHLLLLRKSPSLPPGIFKKEDCLLRRKWRQVQYLADRFWSRWVREYLPLLQERQKWVKPRRNFETDDLVLVVNEDMPRGRWPIGRVVATHPDKRGLVRQIEVKVGSKYYKRPISKLCLLEASK
ncbi:uncharacterized protein LOC121431209 [Lytechinus variegatus]|uniref:uncharacterized protein LOC121431209 n=1 Tax=Lytechinus variegatus TaxID=7654 RepID=UPI001BB21A63|nr:uncharacterized protein LOC121431209 [Lytechinus variegatus]